MTFYFYFAVRFFAAPLLLSAVAVAVLLSLLFRSFRLSLCAAFLIAAVLGSCAGAFVSSRSAPLFLPQSHAEQTQTGFLV